MCFGISSVSNVKDDEVKQEPRIPPPVVPQRPSQQPDPRLPSKKLGRRKAYGADAYKLVSLVTLRSKEAGVVTRLEIQYLIPASARRCSGLWLHVAGSLFSLNVFTYLAALNHADHEGQISFVMQVADYLEDGQLKVMRNTKTSEEVLVKFVGTVPKEGIPKGLEREIINHRRLLHPNIVQFYEVCHTFQSTSLTQLHPSHGLVSRLRWCACIGRNRH